MDPSPRLSRLARPRQPHLGPPKAERARERVRAQRDLPADATVQPRERCDVDDQRVARPRVRPRALDASVDQDDGGDPSGDAADLPTVDLLEKVIAALVAHEVWIEAGQQLHRRSRRGPRQRADVFREQLKPRTRDVDVDELLRDHRPRVAAPASERWPEPAEEVAFRGGAVRAQVPPCELRDRLVRVDLAPLPEPLPRIDERDLRAAIRSEREQPSARRGLEEAAPAARESLAHM